MIVGGCHKSKYGCCSDGVTPAGPDFEGCPFDGSEQDCRESEFGCCIDGVTPAAGPFGYAILKLKNIPNVYDFILSRSDRQNFSVPGLK